MSDFSERDFSEHDFIEHAIEIIQRHTRPLLEEPGSVFYPKHLMGLAAHAYAIACRLTHKEGAAALERASSRARVHRNHESLLRFIAQLSPDPRLPMPSEELYGLLIELLKKIELTIASLDPALQLALPPQTDLQDPAPCSLIGTVSHRFSNHNILSTLRWKRLDKNQTGEVAPPSFHPAPQPSRTLDRLRLFWDSDAQSPDVQMMGLDDQQNPLWTCTETIQEDAGFRILMCPLGGPFNPQFDVVGDGFEFRTIDPDSMAGLDELLSTLSRLLDAANREKIHVIVLPELMICATARRFIVEYLQNNLFAPYPHAVLAGSFHVWKDTGPKTRHYVANESVLLDHLGETLVSHEKRGPFAVPAAYGRGPSKFFPDPKPVSPQASILRESIRHKAKLEILETALGRIAIAICADLIGEDNSARRLIERVSPDLLLIPSLSLETRQFVPELERLAKFGVSCIYVNAHCSLEDQPQKRDEPKELLAAVYWGLFAPKGSPAHQIRWCLGDTEPEVCHLNPVQGPKDWQPVSRASINTGGARILQDNGQTLGLLVDLRPQTEWGPRAEREQKINS